MSIISQFYKKVKKNSVETVQKKKKKLQITYTENENEDIITDHADIKKDKKQRSRATLSKKFEKSHEMDEFL